MAAIRTIEASRQHIEEISSLVCAEHRALIEGVGADVREALLGAFDLSFERKAFYVEEQLLPVGGATGTLLGTTASVWMALSRHAGRHPVSLVRNVRRQVTSLLQTKHELRALAFTGASRSARLLVLLGFHCTDFGPGAVAYTRQDRRRLLDHLHGADVQTVPLGTGLGIALRCESTLPIGATAH